VRHSASVLIVGGGAVGTSTAYHLAQMQQRDVMLVEQSTIASGASSKADNIVERQFVEEIDILLRVKAFEIFPHFFEDLGVPFRKIGYLRLTGDKRDLSSYKKGVRIQRRLGIEDSRVVEPDELGEMFPFMNTEGLLGGLYGPSDGITDGEKLTKAYAREARKGGVKIWENTKVKSVRISGDKVVVKTSRGEIRCDKIVNATGPWASKLGKMLGLEIPVSGIRRQTVLFESSMKSAGMLTNCVDMSTNFYVHGSGYGRRIFSGLTTTVHADPDRFDHGVDPSYLDDLAVATRFRAPGLVGSRLVGGWAGVLDRTPDSRPIVGLHPSLPQLVNCSAGGFGIQLSPILGKLVAEIIVNGEPLTISKVDKLKIERFQV
jgi:sarcosine oxidase subunit beta